MKTNQIFSVLLFLALAATHAQKTFDPDQRITELSGKKENIGISASILVDGEILWTKSEGLKCEDNEEAFTSTTLTRIASIAKNFTAVAIMQLAEQGKLNIEDNIGKYLNKIPNDKKQITIKQLLAHTSGISQYQNDKEIENTVNYKDLDEAMKVFIERPLMFDPGTKYFYTSYGYVVLGRIIEAVSSMRYENYMKQNIFERAAMKNTVVEKIDQNYEGKSCLYHNNGRKAKAGKQNDLSNRIPGGGFLSTTEDLIKFGHAIVDGKLITQDSLEQMLEIQPVEYDGNKYGLGWYLYGPAPYENLVIGHSGGQTGCTSQLMIIPKSKTVVVVLSNTSGNYPDIANFASNLIGYSEKDN